MFPLQLLLRKCWWRCFEAAYIMWRRECLLAPFCLSSLAQTGPEVLVCLKPHPFILLVTEKKKRSYFAP